MKDLKEDIDVTFSFFKEVILNGVYRRGFRRTRVEIGKHMKERL